MMKAFTVVICLCLGVTICWSRNVNDSPSDQATVSLSGQWNLYKQQFGKSYKSWSEEQQSYETFAKHYVTMTTHNEAADKGEKQFRLGMSEYFDMDHGKLVSTMNGYRRDKARSRNGAVFMKPEMMDVPTKVDWRDHGYVTPIKNQGQCGSCWAFSTTGSLEGQTFRKTGKLPSLSEQNLVDCSRRWGNNGCEGGLMDNAFTYIRDNKGIDTESSYPYEARDDNCRYRPSYNGATDVSHTDVSQGSEQELMEAVATVGPVSVAIDASHESFQLYRDGVYYEPQCSSEQLDHGVLVVGYGTEGGSDYWLVKNSWGQSWGMDGFIKMSRNRRNNCGIASEASYPIV